MIKRRHAEEEIPKRVFLCDMPGKRLLCLYGQIFDGQRTAKAILFCLIAFGMVCIFVKICVMWIVEHIGKIFDEKGIYEKCR